MPTTFVSERGVGSTGAPAAQAIVRDNRPGRSLRGIWYFPFPEGRAEVDRILQHYPNASVSVNRGNPKPRFYVRVVLENAAPRVREYVDIERERGVVIQTSLRKSGFTDAQKREAKNRDGGCVGNGRYGECADTQPLDLCQVDHIDPDGPNALWNAQTLCGNCHDWKTAVENGWWTP